MSKKKQAKSRSAVPVQRMSSGGPDRTSWKAGALPVVVAAALCLSHAGAARAAILNVQNYGAVGNGTADDGAAIQNAVNAAIRAGAGNEVYFPTGTYLLGPSYSAATAQIVIKNAKGLSLVGAPGTILTSAAPAKDFFYLGSSSNVTVKSLTLNRRSR